MWTNLWDFINLPNFYAICRNQIITGAKGEKFGTEKGWQYENKQ